MRRTAKKPRLVLIAAGGTISLLKDSSGRSVPTWTAADLLAQTSLRHQLRVRPVDFVSPDTASADSLLALARRIRTAVTPAVDGIVVTHGTDAMEEVAYAVDELVAAPAPIVFTGAMRPGWASGYDGIRNLDNALRVASLISAAYGTLVTLNDQIFEAWSVSKADTGALDAFTARRGAPFGQIIGDQVECPWRPLARPRLGRIPRAVPASVPILSMALAEDAALLDGLSADQVQGLVIAGMATGTIPPRALSAFTPDPAFSRGLRSAGPVQPRARRRLGAGPFRNLSGDQPPSNARRTSSITIARPRSIRLHSSA